MQNPGQPTWAAALLPLAAAAGAHRLWRRRPPPNRAGRHTPDMGLNPISWFKKVRRRSLSLVSALVRSHACPLSSRAPTRNPAAALPLSALLLHPPCFAPLQAEPEKPKKKICCACPETKKVGACDGACRLQRVVPDAPLQPVLSVRAPADRALTSPLVCAGPRRVHRHLRPRGAALRPPD